MAIAGSVRQLTRVPSAACPISRTCKQRADMSTQPHSSLRALPEPGTLHQYQQQQQQQPSRNEDRRRCRVSSWGEAWRGQRWVQRGRGSGLWEAGSEPRGPCAPQQQGANTQPPNAARLAAVHLGPGCCAGAGGCGGQAGARRS